MADGADGAGGAEGPGKATGPISGIQKLFTRFVSPSRAAAMEAESRTWMIRCPNCGYEQSVWAAGGVQYKAAGDSYQLKRCPHCGKLKWHKIYRRKDPK